MTCASPPANECANGTTLTVYSQQGACNAGACVYTSTPQPCTYGCAAGACTMQPCLGVTCSSPPPNVCANATTLTVYDVPGSCSEGACTYASHTEFCASGCAGGACNLDPCVGVTCNSPPASYCSGPNTLRVGDAPGTCSTGSCTYGAHDEYCAFGCAAGACTGDPCVGVSCSSPPASYCSDASTRVVYAATGTCAAGACTYSSTPTNCPNGCSGGACVQCSTTPNCPTGQWCNAGTCEPCNTAARCGSTCMPCAAPTPECTGTACVQCTTAAHCGPGQVCTANACQTPTGCAPPASACTSAGSQDGGCGNAYRISRTTAGSGSGFSQGAYGLCGRGDNFSGGGCSGGSGSDAEYRLFMKAGETATVTLAKANQCLSGALGNLTLKVFEFACDGACACAAPGSGSCSTSSRVFCQTTPAAGTVFTAAKDGWYTFVVDGDSTDPDRSWAFTMTLRLTCTGGCTCT